MVCADFGLAFLGHGRLICALDMSSETIESIRGIEFLAWLEVNKKRLAVGGLVVALLVSGLALYRWRSAQQEMAANSALVQLLMRASNRGTDQTGPTAGQLLELSDRHRGTDAGRRAVFLAAGALFREGKYAESQASFDAFRSAHPGDPLAAGAELGVAACLEATGKIDEAIGVYREVVAAHPDAAAAAQAKLALASLLESKNEPQQALQFYEQLRTTGWMNEADIRRQALLARHPELAPTNSSAAELAVPGLTIPQRASD
jgi:predicted negative regulator of RcsB-dependent stress response